MDSQINAVIENLCTKFDVSVEYLVPRMQAYKMAMCQFGFITAAVFAVIFGIIGGCFIVKATKDDDDSIIAAWVITVLMEVIPVIVLLVNVYDYIGWKYAPEIKMIEYVAQLVKR